MTHEENKISDLIDGGLDKQAVYDKITALQNQATAASLECIHHMSLEHQNNKKYLEALRRHGEVTREINRLKQILKQTT